MIQFFLLKVFIQFFQGTIQIDASLPRLRPHTMRLHTLHLSKHKSMIDYKSMGDDGAGGGNDQGRHYYRPTFDLSQWIQGARVLRRLGGIMTLGDGFGHSIL